jgi:hypothetical protein
VEFMKVVGRAAPFTRTTEFGVNLVPVTFSVRALLPAGTLCGVIAPVPGGGLFTVNVNDEEVAPPGIVTIT